jgi:hypothetical protein
MDASLAAGVSDGVGRRPGDVPADDGSGNDRGPFDAVERHDADRAAPAWRAEQK